ncbi:hypothetical protein EKD16_03875 [Streptomonospora litoralis]|uniref:Uncharacterized protein n=1 Tax=Streptomonospora litoralis TaxID=2498135 RepID=A0A4P6PWV3_9ACTN|nr:hypothetical protein EKD16_03875 [Streptomonospora litoralis]
MRRLFSDAEAANGHLHLFALEVEAMITANAPGRTLPGGRR